ncbi:DinB family protein [Pseudoalteromonas peptidolytica]|uniref:Damage-inducible protein DinB n=1 Tax=Pseudoalteromonas peptidolytica F12-50-A1 TaxID=1315280 RepID=A0A8I0N0M4_9GAMM|nr:DinB family protein [Pseudoalteromonas peptidolytica]MBE0348953.1 hypothetical protein [Pseudoalteromonas peptidolytica F12-50-A1]NLR16310.1 damage-inducible protein DinB [Pseudoalteromonas peptidolytica]GEK10627.1 hypothetical protein PPE03_28760 [Pseudoalteromonas peptidolytica]
MKSHFELMADYNCWMNERMFEAIAELSDIELHQPRGAFFSSIIGSLNHILVADVIWLKRFSTSSHQFKTLHPLLDMTIPSKLDDLLYDEFATLRAARVAMDEIIINFVEEVTDEVLATELHYQNTKGKTFARKLSLLLLHLFNHQTHHRGQVTTLLNQIDIDMGETDLLARIPL